MYRGPHGFNQIHADCRLIPISIALSYHNRPSVVTFNSFFVILINLILVLEMVVN